MTILHIVAPGEVGGLERVVHLLAAGQHGRGHRVGVAIVLTAGEATLAEHPFARTLLDEGVVLHPILAGRRNYLSERRQMAALCQRIRPNVVHTHGYRVDLLDAGAARALGIPTVTTVHGFTGGDLKNRAYEILQRRAFGRFSAVVTVSRPLADQLRGRVRADRLHVLPNAWEAAPAPLSRQTARDLLGVPQDGILIGWVGRLGHEKGADVMLDALPWLIDLPFSVSFVGDGRERTRLEARATRYGLRERVRWHGVIPDAARLFPAFDLFVISSRTEGTPISLLEAMAAGTPVVATAVGGIPDVVGDGEALLVPAADPRALGAAIRFALTDREASLHRAAAARRRLQSHFGLEGWLDGYDRVYSRVASHADRSARLL